MSVPLLMLPGIAGNAAAWTGMPPGEVITSGAGSIAGMASDVLARAPDRFALAGHSMGGYVALAIVAEAPARVERLALLSSSAAPDTAEQRTTRLAMMAAARTDYDDVVEILLRALLHDDARADAGLVDEMRAMLRGAGLDVFLRQQAAALARPDMRALLADIAVPTLLLHGEEDRVVAPDRSSEMAAAIPHATLTMLPRCGHAPQRERPGETSAAMTAWLEQDQ